MNVFGPLAVHTRFAIGIKARCMITTGDGRIVAVGRQHVVGMGGKGIANHAEQAQLLGNTVDSPAGVEDLVAAMLGIGLRKHHQLNVAGVARKFSKTRHQVIDFIVRQGQAERAIGFNQRSAAQLK